MAERVVVANYENMIQALKTCANDITIHADELLQEATVCASALGDSDEAVPVILESVNSCKTRYEECAQTALQIAAMMREELDHIMTEKEVWSSED